tara:strand:- start:5155 stop:5853 length:699 start_codon:yes stop_codon:yes gene_type:complete
MSSEQQWMALNNQSIKGMQGAIQDLRGQPRGTQAEQLQMAMASLDPSNPADAEKLIKIMMATGDRAGAAKLAASLKATQQDTTTRESLIRTARSQGNKEIVDFLKSGGDLRTAASVVFGRTPAAKTSSLSGAEEDEYKLYWEDLTEGQQRATGIATDAFLPFVDDKLDKNKLKKLFITAESIYTNNPEIGRQGALMQVLSGGMPMQPPVPLSQTEPASSGTDSFGSFTIKGG